MQNEGQPGQEPDPQQPGPQQNEEITGPARYAFTPPDLPPKIEFRRTRTASSEQPARASRHRRGRRRLWLLWPAVGLVLVLVVSVAGVALQGRQAASHLRTAAGLFGQLQQQIRDADLPAAKGTLVALQRETRAAHDATDGIGWSAGAHLPFVGDDLSAVRVVSEALDDLAANGLPALIDVATGLDPATLSPREGRVDLSILRKAAPRIETGLAVIRRTQAKVATIATDGLAEQLATAVSQLTSGLYRAERLTSTADRAARLLPTMLGADGPRTYLLLFQNLAEVRATGGMPGAYVVVRADAGTLQIADQGTAAGDLKTFNPPVTTLDEDLEGLYTDRPAVFPADVNLTPDFPTAAMLARRMYQLRSGVAVDGVLATDPVVLSYLLRVTGPLTVPKGGGTLNADNAVRLLLSDAYAKYTVQEDQDRYFANAARATFEALIEGRGRPQGLFSALAHAAGERRLLVWSSHPAEESNLVGTVLAGRLPSDEGASPTVGLFLNDGSGAKLGYYFTQAATLSVGSCDDEDGTRSLRLRLILGSTAPSAGLSEYVTGLGLSGDPYTVRTNVMVFSPIGGAVVDARLDGVAIDIGAGIERERGVAVVTVDLPPGATKTLDVIVQTGELPQFTASLTPRLWTTPMVHPWKTTVIPGVACT